MMTEKWQPWVMTRQYSPDELSDFEMSVGEECDRFAWIFSYFPASHYFIQPIAQSNKVVIGLEWDGYQGLTSINTGP